MVPTEAGGDGSEDLIHQPGLQPISEHDGDRSADHQLACLETCWQPSKDALDALPTMQQLADNGNGSLFYIAHAVGARCPHGAHRPSGFIGHAWALAMHRLRPHECCRI